MRTIKVRCLCCNKEYEAIITSTCSKVCGGIIREQRHRSEGTGKAGKANGWMDGFEIKGNNKGGAL